MFFSRKVAVTFIDSASNQVIGQTSLPPDKLPESFLLRTTMHLGDQDWTVESADPPTRAQYAKTRKLVLRLAREQTITVDPSELLFSLPTINNALPVEDDLADGSEYLLLEDDWRQIEFVHEHYLDSIAAELSEIQRVCSEHRKGVGYTKCHVRKRIDDPLQHAVVEPPLVDNSRPQMLRFHHHDRRVRGGFAIRLSADWVIYGSSEGARAHALGLLRGSRSLSQFDQDLVARVASAHALHLVDWCRQVSVDPRKESVSAVFA